MKQHKYSLSSNVLNNKNNTENKIEIGDFQIEMIYCKNGKKIDDCLSEVIKYKLK